MGRIGYTWNEEFRKQFYESENVKAHLEKFIEQAKQPKSPEQREKMSLAKRGRKYSEQHKKNMSETHKFREALRREIQSQHPELPKEQVWALVRERMEQ